MPVDACGCLWAGCMAGCMAQAGADKDKATFDEGFTPLHLACHRGSLEVIHLLLAAGANKDKTLSNGHFGLAQCGKEMGKRGNH